MAPASMAGDLIYHPSNVPQSFSVFHITHAAVDPWPKLFNSGGMNQIILLKTSGSLIQRAYSPPNLLDWWSFYLSSTMTSLRTWGLTHQWKPKRTRNKWILCDSCLERKVKKMIKQKPHAAFLDETRKYIFIRRTRPHIISSPNSVEIKHLLWFKLSNMLTHKSIILSFNWISSSECLNKSLKWNIVVFQYWFAKIFHFSH